MPDHGTTLDVCLHLSRHRSRLAVARIDGLLKRQEAPNEVAIEGNCIRQAGRA